MEELIMKTLVVLISVFLFCLSGIAGELDDSWVVTKDGKLQCKKVNIGYNKFRIVCEDGDKTIVPISDITSYAMDNKVFTKLPLYVDRKPTGKMVFMELLKTVGDLSLYKLEIEDIGAPRSKCKIYCYFLYNGNKLHLALDEKTLPNICKHFEVDKNTLPCVCRDFKTNYAFIYK
jgi:hypothetical protein